MRLIFLDQNSVEIGSGASISTLNSSWTLFDAWELIPPFTRTIQVELKGTRNGGEDNDSYFDDLFLSLGSGDGCDQTVSVSNRPLEYPRLKVVPNPIHNEGFILLPGTGYEDLKLFVVDINGAKVDCPMQVDLDKVYFDRAELKAGTYVFWLRSKGAVVGTGKIIIQ